MFNRCTHPGLPYAASPFSVYRHPWQSAKLYGRLRRDVLGTLGDLVRHADHCFDLRVGSVRVLLLSRSDDIHEVLIAQNRAFEKARGPIFWAGIFGQGLLTSEGVAWGRARRLVQPVFHRQRVAAWSSTIVAFTHRQIQDWCEGQERDMAVEMMTLALTIVSETLFGFQGETVSHQVRNATSQAMQFANRRQWALFRWPTWIPTPSSRRFVRACQQLVDAVSRIIGAPEEEASAVPGLLTLLCEAVDEDGIPMSAQELRDHCLTLLLTEHETTGNALAWLWYLLGDNPQVRARLETELREQLGPEALTAESLSRLPYLSAVVRESLRLYPTVWAVVRQAVAPFHLRDIAYPSQVYVVLLPWVVHRQARCFPDPEAFRPERWLDGSTRTLSFFAYFPFCGGPRLCIASPFALTEAALVMGTICQQFRLESLSAMPIAPEPLVTLRPAHGVPMRLSCRPQENDRDPSTRRSLGDPEIASRPIWPVAP